MINKINNNLTPSIRLIADSDRQERMSAENSAHINRINSWKKKKSLHRRLTNKRNGKWAVFSGWDDYGAKRKESTFIISQPNLNFKSI